MENDKKHKFHDLSRRFLVSSVIVVVLTLLVVLTIFPVVQIIMTVVIAAIAAVGVWEFATLIRAKQLNVFTHLMVILAVLQILAFYLSLIFPWGAELPLLVLIIAAFSFFFYHFREVDRSISSVATQFFGLCYVAVPLGLIMKILYPTLLHGFAIQDGRLWFAYLIATTKSTDIAAYFGGKLFGKRLLAKNLSPSKTVEGSLLGLVGALVVSLIFWVISTSIHSQSFELGFIWAVILGAAIGIVAQLGDLAESLLKRDAGVKDSNRIPGIGGVLDLLDALFFTTPFVYFYLYSM